MSKNFKVSFFCAEILKVVNYIGVAMKKLYLLFCIVFFICFTFNTTIAGGYEKITSNAKISAAISALETVDRHDVIAILSGRNSTGKPIRVMFRNLAIYGCTQCEAFTAKTRGGDLVIYINEEHKDAPVETLACLIAHESQHHTFTNTRAEELRAWVSETTTWNAFVRKNRSVGYLNHPLVKRENYISKLYVKQNGVDNIRQLIAKNPVYANLEK
mgnify:CR=1 FL=1